ncbi:unnamed protein product [Phytophthora fragariaefolia]|uniref:Unnamed protein product n=1 Tax=Phytophthora fragariaefolia TaxID=1490495 RepID=A0A9W6XZ24_9STRA|nr:unnamed protein product [Phytophthora fragariaefolia]
MYHLKCENIEQELQQVRLDIEIIRDKILEEEREVTHLGSKTATALSTAVVHEDAAESVQYYRSEAAELEELARGLETELQKLAEVEPVVHFAATLIQAMYRGVRMLQSKELCYERIHASWVIRNQKLWDASARIIAGLYHIQRAKQERVFLRRDRAARLILRLYRDVQARTAAKQSLQWKKVKLHAKELAKRKLRSLVQLTWSGWQRYTRKEAQRKTIIAFREASGLTKWEKTMARRFLYAYRMRIANREHLEREIVSQLDARVLHHIRTAIQTSDVGPFPRSVHDISSLFLLLIRNDVWAWQVPNEQLYFLAQRYSLPLDLIPLKQIHHWLAEESPSFVDLYAPLPTQTLLLFDTLSQHFALHSRILAQIQQIREAYEAHMLMREYLALLYSANVVRLSPSTTFSSQQRQRAVDILFEKDRVEYLPNLNSTEFPSGGFRKNPVVLVQRDAFTSFHCVWNHHLCERCLAMRSAKLELSWNCKCCGHHHYEANTMSRSLQLEAQGVFIEKNSQDCNPTRVMWASTSERCDFVILNAFLHALAPVNHENREKYSVEVLWKLAMRDAYEPMIKLYNQLQTGSLNDLLNASQDALTWAEACCPPGVTTQLQCFITILKNEWTHLDAQLTREAQAAGALLSGKLTLSKAKRRKKKNQRFGHANERLEPLVNSATNM